MILSQTVQHIPEQKAGNQMFFCLSVDKHKRQNREGKKLVGTRPVYRTPMPPRLGIFQGSKHQPITLTKTSFTIISTRKLNLKVIIREHWSKLQSYTSTQVGYLSVRTDEHQ